MCSALFLGELLPLPRNSTTTEEQHQATPSPKLPNGIPEEPFGQVRHPLHLVISKQTALTSLQVENDCEYFYITFRRPEIRKNNLPSGSLCFTLSDDPVVEPKVDEDNSLMCVVFVDDVDAFPPRPPPTPTMPTPTTPSPSMGSETHQVNDEGSEVDYKTSHSPPRSKISLYCTEQFLQHYGWEPTQNIVFKPMLPYPLQKVILMVKNIDTYDDLRNFDFTSLLLQVCRHGVLVRTNDMFLAPWIPNLPSSSVLHQYQQIIATECCPFRQGLLTIKTEIFTVYDENLPAKTGRCRMDCLSKESLFFSNFCSWIRNRKPENQHSTHLDNNQLVITAKIAGQKRLKEVMIRTTIDQEFDPNYIICMPRKLMLDHSLYDSTIVEVYCLGNKVDIFKERDEVFEQKLESPHQRSCIVRSKLAMVKCLGRRYDRSLFAFISPTLLFNIQVPPQNLPTTSVCIVIKKPQNTIPKQPVDSFLDNLKLWNLVVAEKIIVSKIKSPGSDDFPIKVMQKFFEYPRLLEKGDIFSIPFVDHCFSQTEHSFEKSSVCYLRVEKIKPDLEHGDRHLVHPKLTTKTLKENYSSHSFVPHTISDSPPYWNQSRPPGLETYVDCLLKLILPFLNDTLGAKVQEILSPTILIMGPAGVGKMTLINAVARTLCLQVIKVNCQDVCCLTPSSTLEKIRNIVRTAKEFAPCILVLRNLHFLGRSEKHTMDMKIGTFFVDILQQAKRTTFDYPLIIIGTSENMQDLNSNILEGFLHHMKMLVPTETERANMFTSLIEDQYVSGDVSATYISRRTAGCVLGDIVNLLNRAQKETYTRVTEFVGACDKNWWGVHGDLCASGVVMQHSDFEKALDSLQASHCDELGTPKIPKVNWEDVGALGDVKQEILDTIQLPLLHPELLAAGLRRSGILLHGPPGTGKTLIAKAVATECSLNFFSVKGPELMNKYVGQSEENVRKVFQQARDAAPCVIFFDELDSLAPNRGRSGDTGGVMDRIVSQLLAELDGLHKSHDVFVIGATNRVDLLDPALLRPGRFDKVLFLGVCKSRESQLKILEAVTRKIELGNFSLKSIVEKCDFNLTGADFYALASDAWMNACKKIIKKAENGSDEVDMSKVVVEEVDFLDALANLVPSVSEFDLEYYKELRNSYAS